MLLIVDANIVFSALIKGGKTLDIFILNKVQKRFEFIAPEYLFVEIENHANEIVKRTGLPIEKLEKVLAFLESEIEFVPFEMFIERYKEAEQISPDPDDVQYFALALKFRGALWSNDKDLKKQSAVKVLSIDEVLKLMKFE